jgi:hypothetical protein
MKKLYTYKRIMRMCEQMSSLIIYCSCFSFSFPNQISSAELPGPSKQLPPLPIKVTTSYTHSKNKNLRFNYFQYLIYNLITVFKMNRCETVECNFANCSSYLFYFLQSTVCKMMNCIQENAHTMHT